MLLLLLVTLISVGKAVFPRIFSVLPQVGGCGNSAFNLLVSDVWADDKAKQLLAFNKEQTIARTYNFYYTKCPHFCFRFPQRPHIKKKFINSLDIQSVSCG